MKKIFFSSKGPPFGFEVLWPNTYRLEVGFYLSSLFDPWIHPLSAKKDLSTLKFNIYATIVSTPVQLELGIRKPLITRGTFGGWGNILSFIIFIF
jgi:hypothetical protein